MAKEGRPNTGTITERGPFQFLARFTSSGKRQAKTHDTREKAERWLDALIKANRKGRFEAAISAHELTLGDALLRRLKIKEALKSSQTQTWQARRLIATFPVLTSTSVYDIDEIDIQEFIEVRQAAGVSNSTVNRELSAISNTFNLARTKMKCLGLQNPVGPTTRLPEPRGRERRLEADEECVILREADRYQMTIETPIGTVIRFACASAMRLSELALMDWKRVDLNQGTVFIPDSKNGKSRSVPCSLTTRTLLRDLGPLETGPVFGTRAAIASAWRRVKAAALNESERLVEAGEADLTLPERILDLRFHDLRHEATSRLVERTSWENTKLKAVTGHQSDAMLTRYTHLRSSKLAAELTSLEAGATLQLVSGQHDTEAQEAPAALVQRQQWRAISSSSTLLRLLVWAKPIVEVAREYGVSDVAVHKACGRLGVEKPVRGHWLAGRSAGKAA